jgi:hypothetical protein
MGHGILLAALLELGLARLGAIGAHLTVDPQPFTVPFTAIIFC